ncbi:DUF2285 domain-containing protein [Mesorhizobium sp. B2-8-9]|uniref:DNA -binding domain-containing protein n=1 Tax=Mesorhizobium sp. B2-8-9 TaxID=2589899 RepID=UPI001FEE693B|nr:DUF2285 domain-containing protein [Mesorhizobium sp. B2-8-9]
MQLALFGEAKPREPLTAIIPFDDMAHDRLQVIERFIGSIHRQHVPDARLTAVQRRRLGHMLRCLDGLEEQVASACSVADWSAPPTGTTRLFDIRRIVSCATA